MKARAMGRFLAEFLEGFSGDAEPETPAAPSPIVVPVEMVRDAVAAFLKPLVEAEDAAQAEEPEPTAEQLSMMFQDAGRNGAIDPLAEATLRRVHEVQEREAARERAERNGSAVPETYDPDDPASTKPWTAPILREP